MEVIIKGKNIDVPPAIKEYVAEKINHIERFLGDQIMSTEVELTSEKNPSIAAGETVEVTLRTKGPVIRAKESSVDMHASVDGVLAKIEKQIKKYKDKTYSSSARRNGEGKRGPAAAPETEENIVRVKRIPFKPMTPEEATIQMDLLGHDFFVFTNADTEEINVVYRRRNANYGLIEPA